MSVDRDQLNEFVKDPSDHFSTPQEVLDHPDLSQDEKRKILVSWQLDEERLLTSTAENMGEGEDNNLGLVTDALHKLES